MSMPNKNIFNVIRLLAALQVVFLHTHRYFLPGTNATLLRVFDIFPRVPIFFVISGLLISAAYNTTLVETVFHIKWDISYGIYIYHMVVLNVFYELAVYSPVQNLILTLIVSIALAGLSWRFIEKPCLQLKGRTKERSSAA